MPISIANGPDWAELLNGWSTFAVAVFTAALMGGVVVAARQLRQDQLFNRVLQTGGLIKTWGKNRYWEARSRIDKDYDPAVNRERANRLATGIERFKGFKKFRELDCDAYNFIEEMARLAEQMELYVSRGAADLGRITDHIGYEVLSLYYSIQDVLATRASREDLNYEGFRDLALRIQHFARLHNSDIREALVWACFPPLVYRGDDESEGYPVSRLLRWRLRQARLRFMRQR